MLNKNALRGFTAGMLAAIIMVLGVWPVVANNHNNWPGPIALAASGIAGLNENNSYPDSDKLDRVDTEDGVVGQGFDGVSPLVIPAAAFSDDGIDPDSFTFSFAGGYLSGKAAKHGCVEASVYLPHAATITDMFASVYDNDSAEDIQVNLYRLDNFSGTTNVMAAVATTNPFASSTIQSLHDDSISNSMILYPQYSYYVTTCVDSANIRLYSVRFYFNYFTTYLPIVIKGS